ncbi:MAG: putative dsRNA-binding protein, partial [Pseudomonadota bacterium]|nr:putative dsRNA-binding protein [Pseudomonadota bacterium]
ARDVVVRLLKTRLDLVREQPIKDPKTLLQERLQGQGDDLPDYDVVEKTGDAHDRRYRVECRVDSRQLVAFGEGTSRRDAEKEAAHLMLKELEKCD